MKQITDIFTTIVTVCTEATQEPRNNYILVPRTRASLVVDVQSSSYSTNTLSKIGFLVFRTREKDWTRDSTKVDTV
jgi:hypothetical protein